jgi:hypothetical protein
MAGINGYSGTGISIPGRLGAYGMFLQITGTGLVVTGAAR